MTETEKPADSSDMYVVHNTLREGFRSLPALSRGVRDADPRGRLVARHALVLAEVLRTHHEAEDAVLWPLLQARCPRESQAHIEAMEVQHRRLTILLESVTQAADLLIESDDATRAVALAEAVEDLLPELEAHLGEEESTVLPLIDRYLTQREWASVGEHGLPHIPDDVVPVYFGMVLRAATAEQQAVLRSNVGPEVFGQIEQAGPPALARYEAELHGRT